MQIRMRLSLTWGKFTENELVIFSGMFFTSGFLTIPRTVANVSCDMTKPTKWLCASED